MSQEYMAEPAAPPELNIPQSDSLVKLSVIDTTSYFKIPIEPFLGPKYKGKDHLSGPVYSFLIQHSSGKHILFDLGIRKDWENYSPVLVDNFKKKKWDLGAEKDVTEILKENGVDVDGGAIDAVIWSHHHWDHIGNLSLFPPSTALLLGPNFLSTHLPSGHAYPTNPSSTLLDTDFAHRDVRDLDIATLGAGLKIGRFNAYDYFGDGSFYLLDTPGHSVGHICGLARVTRESFVFLGGDASHHGGEFRPSEYLPLPKEVSPSPFKGLSGKGGVVVQCPGHLLQEVHRTKSATEPFYLVEESFAHDLELCNWTIAGLQEFDAQENVLLLIAHDESVGEVLRFFPESCNDWFERDVARKVKWTFLGDFEEAVGEVEGSGK